MRPTAEQIRARFGLKAHPTCGFVRQTYLSREQIPGEALPARYASARAIGSVLMFMVTPDAAIRMHRIRSDQMYHHYLGDPLEVLLLYPNGHGEVKTVSNDLAAGLFPQLFIPAGTFHISRVRSPGDFSLLGTSEWIAVEPQDVELGDSDRLSQQYPLLSREIREFMRVLPGKSDAKAA